MTREASQRVTTRAHSFPPFTIHYGLIREEYAGDAFVPTDTGLITNGDSFLEWGEPQDHTLHVQRQTILSPESDRPYETSDRNSLKEQIDRDRQTLSQQGRGIRLVDYVVITPTEDWSTQQWIWTLEGALS